MDITPLSVYPNEKESLLAPGTRLKVLSRKRTGSVNEIHVEEIETAVEPRPEHAVASEAAEPIEEVADHPYSGFSVEPAKSNRSTCKGCGTKIDKGEVRIGCELEDLDGEYGGHTITQWRKVECVPQSWIKLDELKGFTALNKAGKTLIEQWLKKKK
jgi:PHP family Zn ribbon phosphoesterase